MWLCMLALPLLAVATNPFNPKCPEACNTDMCAGITPNSEDIACALPEGTGSTCVGDFCCVGCVKFNLFWTDLNATIQCSCKQYQDVYCMAPKCQPCKLECLPWYLRQPFYPGPLGTGLLCCGDTCDDCCSHGQNGRCCNLACPCIDPGSDCPTTAAQAANEAILVTPVVPALWVPLLMMASLPLLAILSQSLLSTKQDFYFMRAPVACLPACLTLDLSPFGYVSLLCFAAANAAAFGLSLDKYSYRVFLEDEWTTAETLTFFSSGFANMSTLNMLLVCLPASHTPLMVWMFGLPFDEAIKWHRWFGACTVLGMLAHALINVINVPEHMFSTEISVYSLGHVYGFCTLVCIALSMPFALTCVRRRRYHLFKLSHYLAYPAVLFACVHSLALVRFMWAVVALYSIDWIARLWAAGQPVQVVQLSVCGLVGSDRGSWPAVWLGGGASVAKITLAVPTRTCAQVKPGSFFFVNVPALGRAQWHPFSVVDCTQAEKGSTQGSIRFVIKAMKPKSWTIRLTELCADRAAAGVPVEELTVKLRGPYGGHTGRQLLSTSPRLVICCGGGIGITPMASHVLGLVRAGSPTSPTQTRKVLVWVVRVASDLLWLAEHLRPLVGQAGVHLHLYISRGAGEQEALVGASSEAGERWWKGEHATNVSVYTGRPDFQQIFEEEISISGAHEPNPGVPLQAALDPAIAPTSRTHSKHSTRSERGSAAEVRERLIGGGHRAPDAAVLACGPDPMVTDASTAARKLHLPFSSGSFLF